MEIAQSYLFKFDAARPKPRNEREEQLDQFLVRLNASRLTAALRPLTYSRLAYMLQGIPMNDLHSFYVQCDRARSFSRFFHWSLKPNQDKPLGYGSGPSA